MIRIVIVTVDRHRSSDSLDDDPVDLDSPDGDLISPDNEPHIHDNLNEDHNEHRGPIDDVPHVHSSLYADHNALEEP